MKKRKALLLGILSILFCNSAKAGIYWFYWPIFPVLTQNPDSNVNVESLAVSPVSCKANRITWKRPPLTSIRCGQIAKYKVYRNDLLVSEMVANESGLSTCSTESVYTAQGNGGRFENVIDEASTHQYKVKVTDVNGVERPTSSSFTYAAVPCADDSLGLNINMTLVTFSDVVNAGCASYPCVIENPDGAPFTKSKAETDMFATSGPNDRPPFAWVLQKNAPNKAITVNGLVKAWVVLKARNEYCAAPYGVPQCGVSVAGQVIPWRKMLVDASAVRGTMPEARIDGFYLYGVQVGNMATDRQLILSSLAGANGLSVGYLTHEAAHIGYFDHASHPMWHSFNLQCSDGVTRVGPDLRNLSIDSSGIAGRCKAYEYGDSLCTMGSGYTSGLMFSAYARWQLGLMDYRNVYTVSSNQTSDTFYLEHLNATSTPYSNKIKLARVSLANNSDDDYYALEYRGGNAWPELDYSANCPGNYCAGFPAPRGTLLSPGVYLRLRVRNSVDLGAAQGSSSYPYDTNGKMQTLMLTRRTALGYYPYVLTASNPSYCDPYRRIRITLQEFASVNGVDSARVQIERNVNCP